MVDEPQTEKPQLLVPLTTKEKGSDLVTLLDSTAVEYEETASQSSWPTTSSKLRPPTIDTQDEYRVISVGDPKPPGQEREEDELLIITHEIETIHHNETGELVRDYIPTSPAILELQTDAPFVTLSPNLILEEDLHLPDKEGDSLSLDIDQFATTISATTTTLQQEPIDAIFTGQTPTQPIATLKEDENINLLPNGEKIYLEVPELYKPSDVLEIDSKDFTDLETKSELVPDEKVEVTTDESFGVLQPKLDQTEVLEPLEDIDAPQPEIKSSEPDEGLVEVLEPSKDREEVLQPVNVTGISKLDKEEKMSEAEKDAKEASDKDLSEISGIKTESDKEEESEITQPLVPDKEIVQVSESEKESTVVLEADKGAQEILGQEGREKDLDISEQVVDFEEEKMDTKTSLNDTLHDIFLKGAEKEGTVELTAEEEESVQESVIEITIPDVTESSKAGPVPETSTKTTDRVLEVLLPEVSQETPLEVSVHEVPEVSHEVVLEEPTPGISEENPPEVPDEMLLEVSKDLSPEVSNETLPKVSEETLLEVPEVPEEMVPEDLEETGVESAGMGPEPGGITDEGLSEVEEPVPEVYDYGTKAIEDTSQPSKEDDGFTVPAPVEKVFETVTDMKSKPESKLGQERDETKENKEGIPGTREEEDEFMFVPSPEPKKELEAPQVPAVQPPQVKTPVDLKPDEELGEHLEPPIPASDSLKPDSELDPDKDRVDILPTLRELPVEPEAESKEGLVVEILEGAYVSKTLPDDGNVGIVETGPKQDITEPPAESIKIFHTLDNLEDPLMGRDSVQVIKDPLTHPAKEEDNIPIIAHDPLSEERIEAPDFEYPIVYTKEEEDGEKIQVESDRSAFTTAKTTKSDDFEATTSTGKRESDAF